MARDVHGAATSSGSGDVTPSSAAEPSGLEDTGVLPRRGLRQTAQAKIYGGTAGQPYDPCFHLACDTIDNISTRGLEEMSDALAHAVLVLSRRNFHQRPLVAPSGAAVATLESR